MIQAEQLASATDPNIGATARVGKTWEEYAGKPERLRVVPWYGVAAPVDDPSPIYVSSVVGGLSGMVGASFPSEGEDDTPLVKKGSGVAFERLKLLP